MPLFQRGSRFGSPPHQDRWLVTRKLGEGQFAEVYEVRDTSSNNKELKVAGHQIMSDQCLETDSRLHMSSTL
jgi:serine/threonine protein kinase